MPDSTAEVSTSCEPDCSNAWTAEQTALHSHVPQLTISVVCTHTSFSDRGLSAVASAVATWVCLIEPLLLPGVRA